MGGGRWPSETCEQSADLAGLSLKTALLKFCHEPLADACWSVLVADGRKGPESGFQQCHAGFRLARQQPRAACLHVEPGRDRPAAAARASSSRPSAASA